jgi:hypothetical protein
MEILSDPITVELQTDAVVMPGPAAFVWRGERHVVKRVLEVWQDHGFSDKRPRAHEWWERRHRNYYRVQTETGEVWELYLDRGSGRRKWYAARRSGVEPSRGTEPSS